MYLIAPGDSTDSANTVVYRYDPAAADPAAAAGIEQVGAVQDPSEAGMAPGWSRWLQGNLTCGCALTGVSDTNGHFVGGLDKMIYQYVNGGGDTSTAGGSAIGISWTFASRRYGNADYPFSEKGGIWYDGIFKSASVEPNPVVVTATVTGNTNGEEWSSPWQLQQSDGVQHMSTRITSPDGDTFQIGVTGTSFDLFSIGPQRLQVSPGSERRGS